MTKVNFYVYIYMYSKNIQVTVNDHKQKKLFLGIHITQHI